MIRNFTDLIAWQKGHEFILEIYKVTNHFPANESFILTQQLKRAAISVTSNIAEGFGRRGFKEKIRFYYIALGSVYEINSQLIVAKDLGYISSTQYDEFNVKITDISKLIHGLIAKTKSLID